MDSRSSNPILIARYQRLLQDAERVGFRPITGSLREGGDEDALTTEGTGPLHLALAECHDFEARAQRVLALLADHAAARHVQLYLLRDQRLTRMAAIERCPVGPQMDALVSEFLADELQQSRAPAIDPEDLVTTTVDNSGWTGPTGVLFVPALLSHRLGEQLAVTGVLVFDIDGHTQPSDELWVAVSAELAAARDVEPLLIDVG